MRPACRSSTGQCGESDAAQRCHRRTACVEAATQPRDGCAAGMRNGRGAWRTPTRACTVLDTVVFEGPKRGVRFASANVSRHLRRTQGSEGSTPRPDHAAGRRLSHRGDHRESEAQSLWSDPWAAVRRAKARSYAAGPGFGGREPSRFLGTKRWKSQKLRQLSSEQQSEWKASEGVLGQPNVNCSRRLSAHFAAV